MTEKTDSTATPHSVKGTLKHGITIGDVVHTEFEMESIKTMGQIFDAEREASPKQPLKFEAAMIAQQLKRIGTFTGPFTLGMMGALKVADYNVLRKAQGQLEIGPNDVGKEGKSD